jgi:hypothetical protein
MLASQCRAASLAAAQERRKGEMQNLEPLPATGISKILTLCEILADQEGRANLYAITHDLHMPFVEVLLTVKSGEMLGLVASSANEVGLTELGRQVHAAPVEDKKRLLRPHVLEIGTFKHVVALLKNAESQRVPAEVIVEELAMRLPQEAPRQVFTTLLNWGRYCRLFEFHYDSNLFCLL